MSIRMTKKYRKLVDRLSKYDPNHMLLIGYSTYRIYDIQQWAEWKVHNPKVDVIQSDWKNAIKNVNKALDELDSNIRENK